jgi:hypothetical protein
VPAFRPEEIFRLLELNQVDYILIGGVAATLHGSNLRTGDVDICPNRSAANLERLADALNAMHARVRASDAPDGVRLPCDATLLARAETWNLVTDFGDFDVSFRPAGTAGFEDLLRHRVVFDLSGVRVPTASLDDVIRSKEAAGRRKDLEQLPTLRLLRDEKRRRRR